MRALSADAHFLARLRAGGFGGHVHSVFARVVNVSAHGDLYTLACGALDDAPNTAIVDAPDFAATALRVGQPVTINGRSLVIGTALEVDLDTTVAWEAKLPSYPADDSRLRANMAIVRRAIAGEPRACATAAGDDRRSACTGALHAEFDERVRSLESALHRGAAADARTRAMALVGLGPGLTPSGDDFLVGLFAVLHLPQSPCEPLAAIAAEVVADVGQRTNAISAAALEAAAHGQVRATIEALLATMLTGSEAAVRDSLARVLAIGSTSGRDIVAGIACGFGAQLHARCTRASAPGLDAAARA